MGEFIMFLGLVALCGIKVNPILVMTVSATLLVVGGNICTKGGRD